ncbi:MAG: hypothetical protein KJ579_05510 [Verrucomicrobia bacterium]|nr:hypothetical protein [Verrucomicrobiota bacterium]
MKIRAILVLLGIVATAALSAVAAHRVLCDRGVVPLDRLSDTAFLARELGLSPEQSNALRSHQEAFGAKLSECCARHCDFRGRLAGSLDAGGDARELIAAMGREYVASENLTWEHIQTVRGLLDAGQRLRYDALVTRCFGGECNMEAKPATIK